MPDKDSTIFSQRYALRDLIGQGGMGKVYVAWDKLLEREVALKLIHKETSSDLDMRQCFNREARAISLMHHPHVVEIYDFGTTDSEQIFLSTELVRGDSLHGLNTCDLPLRATLDIILQLLQALDHAHARGLIHRDLKAENVLITMRDENLWVKLADFGLAALPESVESIPHAPSNTNFGTPGYIAPEQILHNTNYVGACTDIYAVGILLYEALSGNIPFHGANALETMRAHLNAPIPDVHWRPRLATCPRADRDALNKIVHTALDKSPWARFLSARDFADAIAPIHERAPMEPLPDVPRIQKLKSKASHSSETHTESPGVLDIGAKIRAFEAAGDSGISWPPSPVPQNIQTVLNDATAPASGTPMTGGNSNLSNVSRMRSRNHAFDQKIKSCSEANGSESEFYREILYRTSALGCAFSLKEAECFWSMDADRALSDCWREALAAWVMHGILEFHPNALDASGIFSRRQAAASSNSLLSFTDPTYVEICQASLTSRKRRALKAQAALALTEAWTSPDSETSWRIAQMWRDAQEKSAFLQACQQSAQQALDDPHSPSYQTAFDRTETMIAIYDEIRAALTSPGNHAVVHAVDWPSILIFGAETSLALERDKSFQQYCTRLRQWVNAFSQPILLAHIQRLMARQCLRHENYDRATELAALARHGFDLCNDEIESARTAFVLADAAFAKGMPQRARQLLDAALARFTPHGMVYDMATVHARLAQLLWLGGKPTDAMDMAGRAMAAFSKNHATTDLIHVQLLVDVMRFLDTPSAKELTTLDSDTSAIQRHGDLVATAHAQVFQLIAHALHDDWTFFERVAQKAEKSEREHRLPPLCKGTVAALRAARFALQGLADRAESEVTTAIACFGPQNRRARAWCHAILGAIAILRRQLRQGVQALERARNDFDAIDDQIGHCTVLVTQSLLAMACGDPEDACDIATDALQEATKAPFRIQASLAVALIITLSTQANHPEKIRRAMIPMTFAVPRIVEPLWHQAIQGALSCLSTRQDCDDIAAFVRKCLGDSTPATPDHTEKTGEDSPSVEIELL